MVTEAAKAEPRIAREPEAAPPSEGPPRDSLRLPVTTLGTESVTRSPSVRMRFVRMGFLAFWRPFQHGFCGDLLPARLHRDSARAAHNDWRHWGRLWCSGRVVLTGVRLSGCAQSLSLCMSIVVLAVTGRLGSDQVGPGDGDDALARGPAASVGGRQFFDWHVPVIAHATSQRASTTGRRRPSSADDPQQLRRRAVGLLSSAIATSFGVRKGAHGPNFMGLVGVGVGTSLCNLLLLFLPLESDNVSGGGRRRWTTATRPRCFRDPTRRRYKRTAARTTSPSRRPAWSAGRD